MRGEFETVPVPVTASGVEAVSFPDTTDKSVPAGVEKQMRIDELTALIDALTGGEFSRMLREKGKEVRL